MKKMIFSLMVLGLCASAKANPILDQFSVALLGHVETIAETKTNGTTQAELLATPFQIGKMEGNYLLGLDGGVLGNSQPQAGDSNVQWTAGVHVHLSPILKKFIFKSISPDYPALLALELNPRYSYNFSEHHSELGFCVGFAFGLNPIQ